MDKTATTFTATQPLAAEATPREKTRTLWHSVRAVLMPVASLRLTVVLFVLSFILVFAGTLAQVDNGIWTVLNTYFRTLYVWIPFQVFVRFAQVFLFVPKTATVPGGFPFPGGWLLGGLLLLNLLAAHLVRFRATWKRSGVLMLHAGLVVLMLSELYTGLFAVEGKMSIRTGETTNYVEHHDQQELAVVDRSNPTTDDVVVVPTSMLKRGAVVRHEELPFDVEVVQYLKNSTPPRPLQPGAVNLATAGNGLQEAVSERPLASGVESDKTDVPSAYLTFKEKGSGRALGTYLVTLWWSGITAVLPQQSETVPVGDKTYEVSLRSKRTYKPYSIQLIEFKHDVYLGTSKPKNFSSRVRLIDTSRGEDRETLIYMNNPLSYHWETFYQSGWLPDDSGTILQVVHNTGWYLPYVSCILVALGMSVHFGIGLWGFLLKRFAA